MADAGHAFFDLGSQYYVAGRFAAFAGLNPVTGNLLHHAVEMYLKGALSKSKSLDEMKDLGHKLSTIWQEIKTQANDLSLDRFDDVVDTLDAFEGIRYPDKILQLGMESEIAIIKGPPASIGRSDTTRPLPRYRVCVQEIDELIEVLFTIASRNPVVYLRRFHKAEAREYLDQDNLNFKDSS